MANFRWLMAVTTRVHSPMVKLMARECGSFHRLVVNTLDSLSKGSYMGGAPWSTPTDQCTRASGTEIGSTVSRRKTAYVMNKVMIELPVNISLR